MNQPLRALHPSETPALFSADEFIELLRADVFDDGFKIELVEGVIVRMPLPMSRHLFYQNLVLRALLKAFEAQEDTRSVFSPFSLLLGPATMREADVGVSALLAPEREYPAIAGVLLVVEIADSTQTRDLESKRLDYARAGIPHYWVVDVVARVTHAMSDPSDGDYASRPGPIPFGSPIAVPETDREIVID